MGGGAGAWSGVDGREGALQTVVRVARDGCVCLGVGCAGVAGRGCW